MKKKLEKDDHVLIINTGKKHKDRDYVEALIDQVKSKQGNKLKLKRRENEDYDDDGNHGSKPNKKLHKLKPKFLKHILGGIRGSIESITAINIDSALLTAIEKDNDDE